MPRADDTTIASLLTISACSILTVQAGQFTDQRIYVDNSPIDSYLT